MLDRARGDPFFGRDLEGSSTRGDDDPFTEGISYTGVTLDGKELESVIVEPIVLDGHHLSGVRSRNSVNLELALSVFIICEFADVSCEPFTLLPLLAFAGSFEGPNTLRGNLEEHGESVGTLTLTRIQ